MPVAVSYPGVYIEEIPSGVRTITGVATSITAFIGRAARGPTDHPVTVNSFGDFERIFGGIWLFSTLGYAVRDFFLNGGSQAIIVRLFEPEEGDDVNPERTPITVAGLGMEAAYPGSWGTNLRAEVDVNPSDATLFNLTVRDASPNGGSERHLNLSVDESSDRRIDKVLKDDSRLVRWPEDEDEDDWPNPTLNTGELKDAVSKAEDKLAEARKKNPPNSAVVKTAEDELQAALDAIETSDGVLLTPASFTGAGKEDAKEGLYALRKADLFNILCIPPYTDTNDVDAALVAEAAVYCERRRAMLLVDPPSAWDTKDEARDGVGDVGTNSKNAALFFPRLLIPDPLREFRLGQFVPCGAVAGICARTDTSRGVWKAPAGLEATLVGVTALSVPLTDAENGELNPLGVNCLRTLVPAGRVVWGSRTLQGDDRLASEWKYIPVRRTALFIEESLYRGTQWVVFEPNDEPLWAQIRLNVGAFMQNMFRQGAFQGTTPRDAYLVKCDKETTTQNDINLGIVNIVVGFAPLKPAEFVIIKIQQLAGAIET